MGSRIAHPARPSRRLPPLLSGDQKLLIGGAATGSTPLERPLMPTPPLLRANTARGVGGSGLGEGMAGHAPARRHPAYCDRVGRPFLADAVRGPQLSRTAAVRRSVVPIDAVRTDPHPKRGRTGEDVPARDARNDGPRKAPLPSPAKAPLSVTTLEDHCHARRERFVHNQLRDRRRYRRTSTAATASASAMTR